MKEALTDIGTTALKVAVVMTEDEAIETIKSIFDDLRHKGGTEYGY